METGKKTYSDQRGSLAGVSISMETQLKQEVERTIPIPANDNGQATISRNNMISNITSVPTTCQPFLELQQRLLRQ